MIHSRLLRALASASVAALFCTPLANSQEPEPTAPPAEDSILHGLPGDQPGTERWILTLRERPFDLLEYRKAIHDRWPANEVANVTRGLEIAAREHQLDVLGNALAEHGGSFVSHWWLINACAVDVPYAAVRCLSEHPAVRRVHPDRLLRPALRFSVDSQNHKATRVHRMGIEGLGVTVAVMDGGFDVQHTPGGPPLLPHPTFYVDGDRNNTSGGGIQGSRITLARQMGSVSIDQVGEHGTSVAAVAAGETWSQSPASSPGHAPEASFAVYAISVDAVGSSTLNLITSTWQQIATDRAQYGISVANISYDGSAPPTWIDQMAMDSLALNGDVFIAAIANNLGVSNSTHYSHGALNVVAVGAVHTDTRRMANFSSRGPLWWDRRPYPDLVANGVNVRTPRADGGSRLSTGTSYAAPQVAGAVALYRSVRPSADVLEIRAALFATAQNIEEANTVAPYNTRNAYGMGYLRDDRLVEVARGNAGTIRRGSMAPGAGSSSVNIPVRAGQRYAVALTWNRHLLGVTNQSDFDLEAIQGGTVLASSTQLKTTYEKVVFQAPNSGIATLRIVVNSVEVAQVPFCLLAVEETPPYKAAVFTRYGTACGTPAPTLDAGGSAVLGRDYELMVGDLGSSATFFLVLGASKSTWAGFPLPLDLGPIGAPGCQLLASPTVLLPLSGSGPHVLAVPSDPSLLGLEVHHQALVPRSGANALGLVSSNGLSVRFGGQL